MAGLHVEKITVYMKYLNFAIVFFSNFALRLTEYSRINNHFIDLEKRKKPIYGSIYSLELMKIETLNTYIKTNFASSFI